jgi:hypothetical protein
MKNNSVLLNAALVGIISAGTLVIASGALAAHPKAAKGMCTNANNSCKGTGACGATKGANECKHHGMAEMTKADCDKMAKSEKEGVEHTFTASAKKM